MNFDEMSRDDLIQKIIELSTKLENYKNKVVELNLVDETTKLLNKRALYNALEFEIKRMVRIPSYLNLTLIGINNISNIEEIHGEKIRDILIGQIASIIEERVRSSDIIGRYEYDAFMIVSPDINPYKGVAIAERVQNFIGKGCYPFGIEVTTSAGVAHYEGESTNNFIDKAEKYLDLSKKEGKNRIVTSIKG